VKMCMPHWDKLRAAIDARGMKHLVPENGKVAFKQMVNQLEAAAVSGGEEVSKEVTKADFNPLMEAHWAIANNALATAGLSLLMETEDKENCPLCYLQDNCRCGEPDCREKFERWVEHAADDMLAVAKNLGLVALS
jgi:hypothetical protein